MTAQELITFESHQVRRDSALMASYIELFTAHMGYTPDCAGCTFKRDWKKFVNSIQSSKSTITINTPLKMAQEKTFKLKSKRPEVLTYKADGKIYRKYSTIADEDFVRNYLKHGSKAEIEKRKKLFSQLPAEGENLESKSRKELDAMAEAKGLDPKEYSNKGEVIEALKTAE